jgi:Ala-tRNA(Pro) deacylase
MSISAKLKTYLDENSVKYLTITHSKAYTSQEVAAALHRPGKELAKAVIIKTDGKYIMAVLSASEKIKFDLLKKELRVREAELASEEEFKGLFPDCEMGAMPIFGNIYNLPVYASEKVLEDEEVYFNAGTHTEAMKLSMEDFKRLAKSKKGAFFGHI